MQAQGVLRSEGTDVVNNDKLSALPESTQYLMK